MEEKQLVDPEVSPTPAEHQLLVPIRKFAKLKARQMGEQAFGDSRVEDAERAFEDIAFMIDDALKELAGVVPHAPQEPEK